MDLIKKNLLKDEKIISYCTKHWAIFIPAIFWSCCTIIALMLPSILTLLAFITGTVAIISILKAAEKYLFYQYILTNKRMLAREGFFFSSNIDIFLQKIDSSAVAQNIGGKLLGFGTLVITGAAGSQHKFSILNNPIAFRQRIQQQLENI